MTLLSCHRKIVAISLATLLCINLLILASGIRAQKQGRIIKQKSWRNEPVKISLLKVKGNPIRLNQEFDADEDWLQGLTISFTNISDKPISYLAFRIDFPHPGGNSRDNPVPIYDFSYGHEPSSANAVSLKDIKPIMPNETKDFTISANDYMIIKELLRQSDLLTVKRIDVVLDDIGFADGTLWRVGIIHVRDANNPNKWIRKGKTVSNLSNPNIRSPVYNSTSWTRGSGSSYMLAMNMINIFAQINLMPGVFLPASTAYQTQTIGGCNACGYVYNS